ncbi:MAG: ATP-binding protein [Planctomycetes bacterium]|nr:ATP-binding protein [Planctomycetota bacterium]
MIDYERLGSFYLGKSYDLRSAARRDELVLYDSKDLVTHAVCVGMTGSGKTGLCTVLLEEAAIDGIPAIVIDPKGDLPNLMLTFPALRGEDFAPWVNETDAQTTGVSVSQFAQQQAELWKKGLADWHQDAARIQRLRDAAEFTLYTPGSNAGVSVSILKSLEAPPAHVRDDSELFRERIATTVSGLLSLMGVQADPLRSREHILLSNIFNAAWENEQNLDLAGVIQRIQKPPFSRVGVLELEAFYPSTERFELAMQINNLLAAPGFSRWLEGAPLDIGAMLYTPAGKPRIAIFSIAHLSDAERMFFVSLLLTQTLGWVRAQSGTTSLRALLYMDEIAGYFPPVANPPSKTPLLTLMKQARAQGLGVVLATQNPVDLDYKGLANAGTWFIGRLQTEQDKSRVLDGLEGASSTAGAQFDRAAIEQMLSALGKRVFLMNNVHDSGPQIFETRWALSYLRGPLTRTQIKTLMDAKCAATPTPAATASTAPVASSQTGSRTALPGVSAASTGDSASRPILPPEIPQYFLPLSGQPAAGFRLHYQPMLLGSATIYYSDAKLGVDCEQRLTRLAGLAAGPVSVVWEEAESSELADEDLEHDPRDGATYAPLPTDAAKPKSFDAWKKAFVDALYRTERLNLCCSGLDETSRPGESEKDFRLRMVQLAREQRDAFAQKLRTKYASKLQTLQDRIRRAQQQVEAQQAQASQSKLSSVLSFGSAVLSAVIGLKSSRAGNVTRAAGAVRSAGRAVKEGGDVKRAEENVDALQAQLAELEAQIREEADAFGARIDPALEKFETLQVKPKKANIAVRAVVLAWAPHWRSPTGATSRGWG